MTADEKPEVGDNYECEKCGMRITVTVACNCKGDDGAQFRCCGTEMQKA